MSRPTERPESVAARIQREADRARESDDQGALEREYLFAWQADWLAWLRQSAERNPTR